MRELVLTAAAVLAANGAVEVWRHGSIFADARARHEAGDRFVDRLLTCPFCLSVWCGLAAVWAVFGAETFPREPLPHQPFVLWAGAAVVAMTAQFLACGLACARAAQLLNDWSHPWSRSPDHRTPRPHAPEPTRPPTRST